MILFFKKKTNISELKLIFLKMILDWLQLNIYQVLSLMKYYRVVTH